jgi:glycosyltransferase involved in cell wall biosynthesis
MYRPRKPVAPVNAIFILRLQARSTTACSIAASNHVNVVLEAQASGLVTIISNQGGPAEYAVDARTGLVVDLLRSRRIGPVPFDSFPDKGIEVWWCEPYFGKTDSVTFDLKSGRVTKYKNATGRLRVPWVPWGR